MDPDDRTAVSGRIERGNGIMSRQHLVLLCGHTVRSSVYVQTLAHAGIVPDAVLVYGDEGGGSLLHTPVERCNCEWVVHS